MSFGSAVSNTWSNVGQEALEYKEWMKKICKNEKLKGCASGCNPV